MGEIRPLTFGPFKRTVTSVEPHLIPPDAASGGTNYLVDPVEGGMFKRAGSAIVGDTVSGAKRAVAGLLESAPEYVPCRLRPFFSESLVDGALGGSPTHSVLYRKEATSPLWPTVDDGIFGTEYVRRPNANYTLLKEFGSSSYPTTGGAFGGAIRYVVQPFWYESGEGGYSRGAFEFARRFVAAGSWATIDAGRRRFYPNLRGTPLNWDGGCNDSSSVVNNTIRVSPTGPFGPLWHPTVAANGGAAGGRESGFPWISGDTFYLSVIFRKKDGSYTRPTIPRDVNSILTGGAGFVTVGTIAGGQHYTSLTYSNIPVGDDDTDARILVRSAKQTRTATTDALAIAIDSLSVIGILENNVQTSYVDTQSVDAGLEVDDFVVRFDQICPPRARYYGTGDQRVIAGYTLPSQNAIQLTCVAMGATSATYSENIPDTSAATSGATAAVYRITETALEIQLTNGGAVVASTLVSIDWATYDTLQKVVDKVNASDNTYGGGGSTFRWRAQLAPGADPTAASLGLCPTVWATSSSTSAASTALTIDATREAMVPIGYKIHDSAGKVAADTYITQKLGTGLGVRMSAAASGSGSAAVLYIYADCGDTACTSAAATDAVKFGWIRTFGSAYPGMIYFRRTALPGYDRPVKDRVYFTTSSPGAAASGVSMAPNAWVRNNRRDGVDSPGPIMGIADVQGAAVIVYRGKTALFINERGSNTGEDFDYRIQTINSYRGSCSPWSVVSINGCCVYASSVGIEATDRSRRTIKLSGDVYEAVRGRGDFAYEIPACLAASAADSPDCWMAGAAWGHRLVYSYRMDETTYAFSVYDFSPGVDSLGLDSLADPESRKTYGWSTACFLDTDNYQFGPRAMGAVARSGGLLFYGALNDNYGTADGRVDQMFTGANDNGVDIYAGFTSAVIKAPAGTRISGMSGTITHKVGYSGVTATYLRVNSGDTTLALSSAGVNDYLQEFKQLTQKLRSPGNRVGWVFTDQTASVGGLVWSVETLVEVLPKVGG